MVKATRPAFVHRIVLGAVLAAAGCGGSATPPRTAGPILSETSLLSSAGQTNNSLAPGQSVTINFVEQTCRYQQYTSDLARGQYAQLGCDSPVLPKVLTVSVDPTAAGKPCALSYTQPSAAMVVFTKTGPGDPATNAPPNFYCHAHVIDPTVHQATASTDFYL